jgi:hypothetical protein
VFLAEPKAYSRGPPEKSLCGVEVCGKALGIMCMGTVVLLA